MACVRAATSMTGIPAFAAGLQNTAAPTANAAMHFLRML
jgi:hypothetical protein